MTRLQAGAATDVGRVRSANEDSYLVADRLFAVADGVGGHQAGEVASQTAVETLEQAFTTRTVEGLVAAVEAANRAVWEYAQEAAEKRGMGTTLTAVALVEADGDEQLAIANVGDSRAYLFQQGQLLQVSEDHSLVEEMVREGRLSSEEAQVHPQRSIITRALGMEPEVEVDSWTVAPYRGDRLLLCSDGLTNEVSDDRIAATLRRLADPREAADDLVRQARAAGGSDNITVVVIDVVDDDDRAGAASAALAHDDETSAPAAVTRTPGRDGWGEAPGARATGAGSRLTVDDDSPRRFTWRVALFLALVLLVVVGGAATVAWYARGAYYVGVTTDDRVAVFKGRPGGIWWFDPTLEQVTDLRLGDLPEARRADVRDGKEVPSIEQAERYLANIKEEISRQTSATSLAPTTTAPARPTTTGRP